MIPLRDASKIEVWINGVLLTNGQVMTIRVAVGHFHDYLVEHGLGEDWLGKAIAKGYRDRSEEVHKLLTEEMKAHGY
jgi:hypothetical protein